MIRIKANVGGKDVFVETHDQPHLDEIVAIWLFEKFGTAEFLEKFAPDGVLQVGVGGGVFDEHPDTKNGEARKEGECAATLAAKALGVDDDSALEGILKNVLSRDLKGGAQPFELAALVDLRNRCHPNEPGKVIEWAIGPLEDKYQTQLQFLEAKTEFEEKAEVERVPVGERTLSLVAICSDSNQMCKFARSAHGCKADIVVQKHPSSGYVQIFASPKSRVGLKDIARMLRLEEQREKDNIVTTDWGRLEAEKTEGAEEWYFHPKGKMLLNGSLTTPNVPTRLSLERIRKLVRIGINPQAFEPLRAQRCQEGYCSSTRSNQCPWYDWGLHRCRQIRWKMKNPDKALS